MSSTRRSFVWGFIALLLALAFLRSLAPERTEYAVRNLFEFKDRRSGLQPQLTEVQRLKDELQRERVALQRWKEQLDLRSQAQNDTHHNPRPVVRPDHLPAAPPDDPDAFTDDTNTQQGREETDLSTPDNHDPEDESHPHSNDFDDVDEDAAPLSDDECPIIVVPESSSTGLGTQIEHIWTSLSLTLAIRNACVVIPSVISSFGASQPDRPVPFHQVFDLPELARTGVRFVPLRTCQENGMTNVFDDRGAESAIVKNFALYVKESHPNLAKNTTLVRADSKGYRFLKSKLVNYDVNVVAEYMRDKLPEEPGRHCVGVGLMRAPIAINPDVLAHFFPAKHISDYIDERFPALNTTLFVKLRWSSTTCDKAHTKNGTVCIFLDSIVPVQTYVNAIAHAADMIGATAIYLAVPLHVPDDVTEYIAEHLNVMDPVLLEVGGDLFTANTLERELAVRSVGFVPDGGAWGNCVQKTRQSHFPHAYDENIDSITMIQNWKDAGSPTASSLLRDGVVKQQHTNTHKPQAASVAPVQSVNDEDPIHAESSKRGQPVPVKRNNGGEKKGNVSEARQPEVEAREMP